MRPILWDVDEQSAPPRMTICFPGRPHRFITVRIRQPGDSKHTATMAAVREIEGFTPGEILLLSESSQPMPVAADHDVPTATITAIEQEERYAGVLHCPACCHRLGRGDSPAIGYLTTCSSCKRGLAVRFAPGAVTVTVLSNG